MRCTTRQVTADRVITTSVYMHQVDPVLGSVNGLVSHPPVKSRQKGRHLPSLEGSRSGRPRRLRRPRPSVHGVRGPTTLAKCDDEPHQDERPRAQPRSHIHVGRSLDRPRRVYTRCQPTGSAAGRASLAPECKGRRGMHGRVHHRCATVGEPRHCWATDQDAPAGATRRVTTRCPCIAPVSTT